MLKHTSSSRLFREQSVRLAHGEPSSPSSSRLWRWTSSRIAKESTVAASCCSSSEVIDNTHCCHRITVRAAGGQRTECATPSRCEQQRRHPQQYSSSQDSIGAVVGGDRVFRGVVRDAVGFKKSFSIEQSDPHIPLKKSTFSTGCVDRIARSKKLGSKRQLFRLRKNVRFGLRS